LIKFKATLPKGKIGNIDKAFDTAGKDLAKRVHKTYDNLVSDWRDDGARDIDVKPVFDESVSKKSKGLLVEVKTNNLKYRFVDLGTPPHEIAPKPDNPSGLLTFPSGFTPRTTVKSLQKRTGGKSGPLIFTPHVDHPGSEGRNFEAPIIEEETPIVIADLKKYIKKELRVEVETYDI